jgi:hypothetical protein
MSVMGCASRTVQSACHLADGSYLLFGGRWRRGLLPEVIRNPGEAAGRDQVVPLRPDVFALQLGPVTDP